MFSRRFSSLAFTAAITFAPVFALGAEDVSPAPETDAVFSTTIGTDDNAPAPSHDTSNLWQRIRGGFTLRDDSDDKLIARHEQWYAARPEYVERVTERAQRYLYYIAQEVEKRGMPMEIALLPIVESAFNPGAYSSARAAGIWQFIPSTARHFGLQLNWWLDERRDVISATQSALDYLQKLHDQFGDWELALAAYNWGEGAVARAQERNRKRGLATDYASLKMPQETRNYVPKLIAIRNIINNPERFGLALHPIPNQPYFTAVSTGSHIDAKLAAQLADISQDEFNALNPAYNRPVILRQGSDDLLLLPLNKASVFRANLESHTEPLVSWQAYQSKKGERLDQLAPRFGLTVAQLKRVNGLPQRAKSSNGQMLLVPVQGEKANSEFEAFNTHLAAEEAAPARKKNAARRANGKAKKSASRSASAKKQTAKQRVTKKQTTKKSASNANSKRYASVSQPSDQIAD
ncbi:MAG: transglycosylase SLT domain-containing protein [Gallionellaceae bacterium]|jgi:membrane-bound lytic murein transglycosylase D|nr:transglycosylase SLT domain-containing protein [Gallionellaceae bacterium]